MDNPSGFQEDERHASQSDTGTTPGPEEVGQDAQTRWQRIRLLVMRIVAILGAFLFLAGVFTAFAGIYTSRPQFCRSCHNMEPYYVSWQNSSHKHVSCIKCHFPPGAAEKIRGKMLGLVQLAKYVTSTAGPRPAAEVPDASCLRSGCHETRLLAGRVDFNGIPFDHRPHLELVRRGKKLRCTSCHSQIVQGEHMAVTTSTCYLCHFKEQPFNQGLGTCTRCHQIPESDFDLGGGVTFNHELVYERGLDCSGCHRNLIRGKGEVPRERCGVCHNREHDLDRIGDHEFLHETHVTLHKVDCLECHLKIEHSFDPHQIQHAASDCQSCHPNHHQSQVKMLLGTGAISVAPSVNAMATAGMTCRSCHKVKETATSGDVVWKAAPRSCSVCHDAKAIDRVWASYELFRSALTDIEDGLTRARTALAKRELSADRDAALRRELDTFQKDLTFLRVGNGIHNVHYAGTLTRSLADRLSRICQELGVRPPDIQLPSKVQLVE